MSDFIKDMPQGSGKCAKRNVVAMLETLDGDVYMSSNYCCKPQAKCPRTEEEGYEKCKSVCEQPGHAETNVLRLAGEKAKGGTMYIFGHYRQCPDCAKACKRAKVRVVIGSRL